MSLPIIETINTNINNLKQTKQNIKDAINIDFNTVTNEKIEEYPELIEANILEYKSMIPHSTIEGSSITKTNTIPLKIDNVIIKGDTQQTNYTGKNLFNYFSYPINETKSGVTVTNNGDGSITLNGTCTESQASFSLGVNTDVKEYGNSFNLVHTAYYISGTCTKVSSSEARTVIRLNYNTGNDKMIPLQDLSTQQTISKVFPQDERDTGWSWTITVGQGDIFDNFTIKYQLEKGSEATEYEPYVGGIPAPNPTFPQQIYTVTGNNIITINDIDYQLNLQNIELCKIGNTQDFIFKNTINSPYYNNTLIENGWYKYGAIRKYNTLSSIDAIEITSTAYRFRVKYRNQLHDMSSDTNVVTTGLTKCAIAATSNYNATIRYNYGWGGIAILYPSTLRQIIGEKTKAELLEWFNNNETLYIVINPTYDYIDYMQITDTTLINQLEIINRTKAATGTTIITSTGSSLAPIFNAIIYTEEVS